MKTYDQVAIQLGIEKVCPGPPYLKCGLNEYRHRGSIDPFGVIHWRPRRMSKRGLRRFLLLAARRERETSSEFLNNPRRFGWLYDYMDQRRADEWAGQLGFRFPVEFSRYERGSVLWRAHRAGFHVARDWPAVYAWATRGLDR